MNPLPSLSGNPRRRPNAEMDRQALRLCAKIREHLERDRANIALLTEDIRQIEALAEQERVARRKGDA